MRRFVQLLFITVIVNNTVSAEGDINDGSRNEKVLSVFNVVTFPNAACGATNGFNGTCYTSSECTSKGGTASGSCASSCVDKWDFAHKFVKAIY